MTSTTTDDDQVPLHHRKAFGSGLKRQRVEFVRASASDGGAAPVSAESGPDSGVGDLYASIVLGGRPAPPTRGISPSRPEPRAGAAAAAAAAAASETCAVCNVRVATSAEEHEASLAHQVNVPHSHPPSSLDRSRMGLRALQAQGWDPDARRGLGRRGEGVRYPLTAKPKDGTSGVGAAAPEKRRATDEAAPPRRLSGKELKAAVARDQARAQRLQEHIYGRVDVDAYLGRKMDD
ncbi:uncharacterized protein UV8b_03603 [Ustilaginoidea virens]|uniref:G-patch domain-containing protein n=1 Tax=Ustilaginoidea virens TaxID=1159556 RepID=A0A8E5HPZ9_USTVR|nr:uncharacterized protein UV8b_03603 [Ustilaginoidea virens]QUC19362.1 hypothetical protein UV8b_03603 [Ustilaginoidea virens]